MATPKKPARGHRPRALEKHAGHVAEAEAFVFSNLLKYCQNLDRLADGVWVVVETPAGKRVAAQEKPDRQANVELLNRALGKPMERFEHEIARLSDEELIARAKGFVGGITPTGADDPGGGGAA